MKSSVMQSWPGTPSVSLTLERFGQSLWKRFPNLQKLFVIIFQGTDEKLKSVCCAKDCSHNSLLLWMQKDAGLAAHILVLEMWDAESNTCLVSHTERVTMCSWCGGNFYNKLCFVSRPCFLSTPRKKSDAGVGTAAAEEEQADWTGADKTSPKKKQFINSQVPVHQNMQILPALMRTRRFPAPRYLHCSVSQWPTLIESFGKPSLVYFSKSYPLE